MVKSKEQEFLDDGKIRDLMVAIASDTITEDEQVGNSSQCRKCDQEITEHICPWSQEPTCTPWA